jgi:hypothetical protein
MRWTVHMEDSLQLLLTSPEASGDRILGAITQVQRITDEALAIMTPRLLEVEAGRTPKMPAVLYVKPLLAKVNEVKRSLSPDVLSNRKISPRYGFDSLEIKLQQESCALTYFASKPASTNLPWHMCTATIRPRSLSSVGNRNAFSRA